MTSTNIAFGIPLTFDPKNGS